MQYPQTFNLGQIYRCTRRDSSSCVGYLRSAVETGAVSLPTDSKLPNWYSGSTYNWTRYEVCDDVPDHSLAPKLIRRQYCRDAQTMRPVPIVAKLTPSQFRSLYIIVRRYETSCG